MQVPRSQVGDVLAKAFSGGGTTTAKTATDAAVPSKTSAQTTGVGPAAADGKAKNDFLMNVYQQIYTHTNGEPAPELPASQPGDGGNPFTPAVVEALSYGFYI